MPKNQHFNNYMKDNAQTMHYRIHVRYYKSDT